MKTSTRTGVALVAICAAFAAAATPASAKTVTKTFSQCVTGGTIADFSATSIAFNVPVPKNGRKLQAGRVTGVTAAVRVSHTANGDLDMLLVNPLGRVISLSTEAAGEGYGTGPGCGGAPVLFSDAGTASVRESPDPPANTPYTGTFKPEQPFASFAGGPARGPWSIIVLDSANEDVGTFDGATLNVTYTYNKPKKKKKKK